MNEDTGQQDLAVIAVLYLCFFHMFFTVLTRRASHIPFEDLSIISDVEKPVMLAIFVMLSPSRRSGRLFWIRRNRMYSKIVIFIYFLKNLQHSLLQIFTWSAISSKVSSWA